MQAIDGSGQRFKGVTKCRNIAPELQFKLRFFFIGMFLLRTNLRKYPEAVLFVCNYAAPSLIKSDVTTAIFSMVGHLLGSEYGPHSCGLLLCPQYSYQKHQLFLEEHALLTLLSNHSCVVDTMFQLNFDIRSKVDPYLITSMIGTVFFLNVKGVLQLRGLQKLSILL